MEIKLKGFITSKKSELYSDCADNYAINTEHNKFAISDGVSKSFFPKIWSDLLVNKYVNQKDWKDEEFISESQKQWKSKIEEIVGQPETKWFTKSQYNRKDPALATFVGLHFLETEQKWIAQALGDSFLFFIPKGSTDIEVKLSSKPEPIVFDNFPDYLSSIGNSHKGEKKPVKGEKIKEGTFYLMTDALAEWFLKDTKLAIPKLTNIQNQEQFLVTIEDERNANRLNDDDSAVLMIEVLEDDKKEFSYSGEKKITLLSDLIKQQAVEIEESKKKEVSSQDSLNINEEESEEEEQLTKEEKSENEISEKVEQSTVNKDNKGEYSDDKKEEEKPLDENESLKENTVEDNLPVENDNISEQSQEEEKSSEQIQNIIPDNPKTKSIFDKF